MGSILSANQILPILTLGKSKNTITYLRKWANNSPLQIINKKFQLLITVTTLSLHYPSMLETALLTFALFTRLVLLEFMQINT